MAKKGTNPKLIDDRKPLDVRRGWTEVLPLLDSKTKVMGLIALVADTALFGSIAFLPQEHRIFALVICAVVLLATLLATGFLARAEFVPHVAADRQFAEPLLIKVIELEEILAEKEFVPDMIIGIARSGLAVAGLLAKVLRDGTPIPTISICRSPNGDFKNPFNNLRLKREMFGPGTAEPKKVLIVDEFSASGRTLEGAKAYVENCIDPSSKAHLKIETAVIHFYNMDMYSRPVPPTFFVDRPTSPLIDSGGDVEE